MTDIDVHRIKEQPHQSSSHIRTAGSKVPDYIYIDHEVIKIDGAIQRLDKWQRLVFKQHWLFDRSFREIESMIEVSKSSVGRLYGGAMVSLHDSLHDKSARYVRVRGTVSKTAT